MKYLLLITSLIFSTIFFLFYNLSKKNNLNFNELSFFSDLRIEIILFFLIGIFFFVFFLNISFLDTKKLKKSKSIKDFSIKYIYNFFVKFFKDYLYYIGFISFYLSFYFIFKSSSYFSFEVLIFFISFIILLLFFITNKFLLFRDFIRINTILFSLYYLVFYILGFTSGNHIFTFLDFINQIFIIVFFILSIYNYKTILKKESSDSPLIAYFFVYIYGFFSFYTKDLLGNNYLVISVIGFLLGIFIYYFLLKVSFFNKNKIILKYLSIIFIYVSIIFSSFYLVLVGINYFLLLILFYGIFFNFFIHKKYQNYLCFFFSIYSFIFIVYYLFFKYFPFLEFKANLFIILSYIISFSMIIFTYLYNIKYITDYFFIYIFTYLINIISVIYFFYITSFDFLTFGVILFLESLIFFLSYFKLRKESLKNLN
ncbi:hypothetical protein CSB08_01115 [Candidatus Gracilibacteria bacterium]|nr:MAG: hypothetical protein CSB08_01115 [Candidatus Gracilibacteria bacterium]